MAVQRHPEEQFRPKPLGVKPPGAKIIPVRRVLRRKHRCPHCGSLAVVRTSRAGPLERVYLSLARQKPYTCRHCSHRFYDRPL